MPTKQKKIENAEYLLAKDAFLGGQTPFTAKGLVDLGDRISQYLEETKRTDTSLALEIGVTSPCIAKLKIGSSPRIEPSTFCKLAKVLPYSARYLVLVALESTELVSAAEVRTPNELKPFIPQLDDRDLKQLQIAIAEKLIILNKQSKSISIKAYREKLTDTPYTPLGLAQLGEIINDAIALSDKPFYEICKSARLQEQKLRKIRIGVEPNLDPRTLCKLATIAEPYTAKELAIVALGLKDCKPNVVDDSLKLTDIYPVISDWDIQKMLELNLLAAKLSSK